jgi:hypothetical protein
MPVFVHCDLSANLKFSIHLMLKMNNGHTAYYFREQLTLFTDSVVHCKIFYVSYTCQVRNISEEMIL